MRTSGDRSRIGPHRPGLGPGHPRVHVPRSLIARTVTGAVLAAVVLAAPTAALGAMDVAAGRLVTRNDVGTGDLDRRTGQGAEVWLVLGSDSRTGLAPTMPEPDPAGLTGQRADSISLWILDLPKRVVTVVSLPRALRVDVAGHGEQHLAVSYAYGPRAALQAVRDLTGLPIHHVVEIDFTGVVRVVDVLGGVVLHTPHPARDIASGLRLDAGSQRLTGVEALAWARSRNYEELVAGSWIPTEAGDLARIERQQVLLAALVDAAREAGPRLTVEATLQGLRDHVRIDREASARDLLLRTRFLFGQYSLEFLTIPVQREQPLSEVVSPFPPSRLGGDSYLVLRPEAAHVLHELAAIVDPLTSYRLRPAAELAE